MRPALALLMVALVFLAACVQSPADGSNEPDDPSPRQQTGGSLDTPSWTVNDRWVVRSYQEQNPNETLEVIDFFVQAIDEMQASGTTMDAFRVVSREGNATTWYRMSDLALMRELRAGDTGMLETVYDTPCPLYQWPLQVGATWNGECSRTTAGETSSLQFTAQVESEETVSVPTGEFTTFRIKYTGQDGGEAFERTEYYAPGACFAARTIVPAPNGTTIHDLIAHHCSSTGSGA